MTAEQLWLTTHLVLVLVCSGRRRNLLGEGDCADKNDQCQEWAFFGECDKNPGFMKENCKRSCKICKK